MGLDASVLLPSQAICRETLLSEMTLVGSLLHPFARTLELKNSPLSCSLISDLQRRLDAACIRVFLAIWKEASYR